MTDVIYGKRAVIEAFRSGIYVKKLYVFDNMKDKEIFLKGIYDLSGKSKILQREVSRRELDLISGTRKHGSVAAEVDGKGFVTVEKIISYAGSKNEQPLLLILNGIEDPQNLGAILRSAEGGGVHGVIIPKRRCAKLTPAVVKASSGAVFHLLISEVANINQIIKKLKKNGIWVVGSDFSGDELYYKVDYTVPTAIIIGSEGEGMQNIVKKNCDFVVKIPMLGKIRSLNASVSAGILIYEALRQRREKKRN